MSNTHYNGYDPKEILTEEEVAEGWGINKNGKPVHPQRYKNLAPAITGTDDPRRQKAMDTHHRKGEITRERKRLEDELRAFKRDSITDAKDRVDSGEIADAIKMLQDSLLEIDIMLAAIPDDDSSAKMKLLDTKIKYINKYADLTIGSVGSTSVQDEEVKEQVTQEDLDKKFEQFAGKFEVVDGGKK